jgi:hypothetical protein
LPFLDFLPAPAGHASKNGAEFFKTRGITVKEFLRLRGATFDPETVRVLSAAFDHAWEIIQHRAECHGPTAVTRERLAMRIIETAMLGERDERRLRDNAVLHLTQTNLRNLPRK